MLFLKAQFDLPKGRTMLEKALEFDPKFAFGFEGVLLLVDSTQGVQAQTLTTLAMAEAQGCTICEAKDANLTHFSAPAATAQASPNQTASERLWFSGSDFAE